MRQIRSERALVPVVRLGEGQLEPWHGHHGQHWGRHGHRDAEGVRLPRQPRGHHVILARSAFPGARIRDGGALCSVDPAFDHLGPPTPQQRSSRTTTPPRVSLASSATSPTESPATGGARRWWSQIVCGSRARAGPLSATGFLFASPAWDRPGRCSPDRGHTDRRAHLPRSASASASAASVPPPALRLVALRCAYDRKGIGRPGDRVGLEVEARNLGGGASSRTASIAQSLASAAQERSNT